MANILIVCTANICRSPVAAGLIRDRLQRKGLIDWKVSSAGTWANVQRGASRYSIDVMRRNGFDINDHQARMIDEHLLAEADLTLTMEASHAEALRAEFPQHAHKIFMITQMIGGNYNIADPYGGPIEEYERMYSGLSEVIDAGLDRMIYLAQRLSKIPARP